MVELGEWGEKKKCSDGFSPRASGPWRAALGGALRGRSPRAPTTEIFRKTVRASKDGRWMATAARAASYVHPRHPVSGCGWMQLSVLNPGASHLNHSDLSFSHFLAASLLLLFSVCCPARPFCVCYYIVLIVFVIFVFIIFVTFCLH